MFISFCFVFVLFQLFKMGRGHPHNTFLDPPMEYLVIYRLCMGSLSLQEGKSREFESVHLF